MKYRGHEYTKAPVNLNVVEHPEAGKYRGVKVTYHDFEAVVQHPIGRMMYRGVKH
ncbi:hypothetical protein KR51_00006820 [Rubidibacter lacunae KORDI 51-2]|uniref:DUF4278 domain-containing protein n=1 Tax=Rubidibacter lacunae KORDI 51-2 TaxID=582515 RepID=U5DLR8_9CHRO|nr:DUF4278 domain-containing protein [Rubidibacter lacunae]ERN42591.1 hypothetical protein KR51_00006820 [Rubidibacter lacunae KORDI 51-2]